MVRRFVSEFQVYLKCSVVVVITALSLVRDAYRLFWTSKEVYETSRNRSVTCGRHSLVRSHSHHTQMTGPI